MIDNEVIKALECCSKDNVKDCAYCPYDETETRTYCANELIKDSLDLINRQKAEVEKLQTVIFKKEDIMQLLHEEHQQTVDELQKANAILEAIEDTIYPLPFVTDFDIAIRNAKSEAIKEFAESISRLSFSDEESGESMMYLQDVYDFVEEMTVNYESSKQRKEDGSNGI